MGSNELCCDNVCFGLGGGRGGGHCPLSTQPFSEVHFRNNIFGGDARLLLDGNSGGLSLLIKSSGNELSLEISFIGEQLCFLGRSGGAPWLQEFCFSGKSGSGSW